jgi:alpha-1,6-mannosyltransferase
MPDEVDRRSGTPVSTSASLDNRERRQLDVIRRFGTVGALLLAVGSLGAGAAPVYNPVWGLPMFSLFPRMTTVSLAVAYIGVFMIVLAWLWLGRLALPGRERIVSLPQMARTLVMWTAPLVLTVPMFSQDVYSYLAQSEIAARGEDPYTVGPAEALGNADILTKNVPTVWRETPSPYGPLFLMIGRGVSSLTGNHVVMGIAFQRLLALGGLAMIVWALSRLARRFGINPVSALWLGAANPLVLFHLVVGVHNEALAIGLMLVGMEVALRRMPRCEPGGPYPPWQQGELLWYGIGATIITLGAVVKIPAALALGFLGVMIARRWGGRWSQLFMTAGALLVIFLGVVALTSIGSGLGFGWATTLNTASTVSRMVGTLLGPLLAAKLLLDSFRWRLRPMIGLGAALGAVLVFGATVQPWYLLWAAIPLASAAGNTKFRTGATVISAVFAVALPPTGGGFDGRTFQLPYAYSAAGIVVLIAVFVVRKHVPSRTRGPVPAPA